MKRRTFLIAGGGSLALLGLGVWSLEPLNFVRASAVTQLGDLARSMQGTSEVGQAFLQDHSGLDPKRLLMQRLQLEHTDAVTQSELIERLKAAVVMDFESGRILTVSGDWLLAETEVWLAALQVALMGKEAPATPEVGFEHARIKSFLQIEDYAPKRFLVGESLQHPDLADNVMWFSVAGAPSHIRIFIDGERILPTVSPVGFSVIVPGQTVQSLWSRPGGHPVWAYEPSSQWRQIIGYLTVSNGAVDDGIFCAVTAWGEQQTRAGEGFNVQPDGSSALWLSVDCAPDDTVVILGGEELPTTVRPDEGLITARVVNAGLYADPGELPLRLFSASRGKGIDVGVFSVLP